MIAMTQAPAWEEISAKLRQFETNGGFERPREMIVGAK
jgi:hypothetical protein